MLLDRQIMRILMTGQAFRESFVQLLAVWSDMTCTALRNETMLAVAAYTIDFAVFARRLGPLDINLFMAGVARFGICVF